MLTYSLKKREAIGNLRTSIVDITFDNAYPTGGEAFDLKKIGLSTAQLVLPSPSGGYLFEFDYANNKIKALTPTVARAAHSHTENSAAAYTQNATTATGGSSTASPGSEVANGTDLSSVTVRLVVLGL